MTQEERVHAEEAAKLLAPAKHRSSEADTYYRLAIVNV